MPALRNCSTLSQIKVRLQFTSQTDLFSFFSPTRFFSWQFQWEMKCNLSCRNVAISLLVLFMFLWVSDVFCMLGNCFA